MLQKGIHNDFYNKYCLEHNNENRRLYYIRQINTVNFCPINGTLGINCLRDEISEKKKGGGGNKQRSII